MAVLCLPFIRRHQRFCLSSVDVGAFALCLWMLVLLPFVHGHRRFCLLSVDIGAFAIHPWMSVLLPFVRRLGSFAFLSVDSVLGLMSIDLVGTLLY
jgi:hypothetical protein